MRPRTTRLVVVLAIAGVVTACTTTADGIPQPEQTGPTSSVSQPESTSAEGQAPRVAVPLDASAFVAAPCTTLTSARASTFQVNPQGVIRGGDGVSTPGCTWHGNLHSISIGWLTDNKGGLSDTYRGREMEAYFIETTVDEYPAVFVDAVDRRSNGYCGIVVGVSDTLTFYAHVGTWPEPEESCDAAEQVAVAALATVKEAQ